MNKSLALLLAMTFATIGLLGVPQAQGQQASAVVIEFVDIHRQPLEDGSVIRGAGAVLFLHIRDEGKVGKLSIDATVKSERDPNGEVIRLFTDREAKTSDEDFYGLIGLEATTKGENGLVAVADQDEIWAEYKTPSPGVHVSQMITWRATTNATLQFSADPLVSVTGSTVSVLDLDRNTDDGVQDIWAHLTSDSDPIGFRINLVENSGNSGHFTASIPFKPTGPATEPPLLVQPGDTVVLRYDDVDSVGHSITRTAMATWRPPHDGLLEFTDSSYRFSLSSFHGTGQNVGFLRYEDPDVAGQKIINVTVRSQSQGSAGFHVKVPLTETKVPGEFVGAFGISVGFASATTLRVEGATDRILASLTDITAAGNLVTLTAAADWSLARTGTLHFVDTTYSNAPQSVPSTGRFFVEVVDVDLNTPAIDWANVTVSTPREPLGLRVTLRESGPGTAIFRGCFDLQTSQGGPGTIQATGTACGDGAPLATSSGQLLFRSGDVIKARYTDRATADGGRNVTIEATSPQVTGAPPAPSGGKGTIVIRECTADCDTLAAQLKTTTSLYGTLAAKYGVVEITDSLYNLNPSAVDSFTVYLSSSESRNQWTSSGTLAGHQGLEVLVTETAGNSGVFHGRFGFTTGPSQGGLLHVGTPGNPFRDAVTAWYGYASHPSNSPPQTSTVASPCGANPLPACAPAVDHGGRGLVHASATWHTASLATLGFRETPSATSNPVGLAGDGDVFIVLTESDAEQDTTNDLDSVTVRVRSASDTVGIQVQLTERRRFSGEVSPPATLSAGQSGFIGKVSLSRSASSDTTDTLKVSAGDSVVIEFQDPHDAQGAPRFVSTTTTWRPGFDAKLSTDKLIYRQASQATIDLEDPDRNLFSTAIESIDVLVYTLDNPDEAQFLLVQLQETSSNSGKFSGQIMFEDPSLPDNGLVGPTDGGRVRVVYQDPLNAQGKTALVTHEFQYFRDSNGGVIELDAKRYTSLDSKVNVTISDPGLNHSPAADVVSIFVYSDSDGTGENLTLFETGANTGIFEGSFGFEQVRLANNGRLAVKPGDRVSVYYYDSCAYVAVDCVGRGRLAQASWDPILPPVVSVAGTPLSGTVPFLVNFTISAVPKAAAIASYSLDFGDGSNAQTANAVPPTLASHVYIEPGTHTVRLMVTDAKGDTATKTVTIVASAPALIENNSTIDSPDSALPSTNATTPSSTPPPSQETSTAILPADIVEANQRVKLSVARDGSANLLTWTLPEQGLPLPIQGVQLWRSNSPYQLVRTLPVGSDGFEQSTWSDQVQDALGSTKYLVTMYFGPTAELGYWADGLAPDAVTYEPVGIPDALPWLLIGGSALLVILLVAGVGIVVWRRSRRKSSMQIAQDVPDDQAPSYNWEPPAPAVAPHSSATHRVRCPACMTRFTALGQKPMAITCHGCGKSGWFR